MTGTKPLPEQVPTSVFISDSDRRARWRRRGRAGLAWLPAGAVLLAAGTVLLTSGVDASEFLRYLTYWVLAVLGPGVLAHRTLRGPRPTLVEDLAFGAATGLALELLVSQALGLVGLDGFVRWWWLAVYAVVLGVPQLRRRVRPASFPERVSFLWSLSLSMVVISALPFIALAFSETALPPEDSVVYQDLWWHLSLSQELLKPGPPQIPQVNGEPLVYHYFANLHVAVASEISTVSTEVVMLRLWSVPVIAVTAGVLAGLARQVSGVSWTGPLAAWLSLTAAMGGYLWLGQANPASYPISLGSPSQVLVNALVVAAGSFFIDLVRRHPPRLQWLWGLVLVMGCSGAKPTAVPILIAGTLLGALALWVMTRRVPWRLLGGVAMLLVVLWVSLPSTAGSTNGKVTVLGTLRGVAAYRELTGDNEPSGSSAGLLLDSLNSPHSWLIAGVIVVWLVGGNAFRLVGLLSVVHPHTRRDPGVWWLAGTLAGGWVAYLVIDHASQSQRYFLVTVAHFGAVLTACFAAAAVRGMTAGSRAFVFGLVLGAAAAWVSGGLVIAVAERRFAVGTLDRLLLPVVAASIIVLLAVGVWWFARCRGFAIAGLGLVVLVAGAIGAAIPGYVLVINRQLASLSGPPAQIDPRRGDFVSADEQLGALWLRENSTELEIAATNLHCLPPRYGEGCDARAFWLSALSGRRMLLEGWGYTPDNAPGYRRPSPWPHRLQLSQEVFSAPTTEAITELREDFGITLLVGVYRAGEVSSDLDAYADRVFENDGLVVFRIRDAPG